MSGFTSVFGKENQNFELDEASLIKSLSSSKGNQIKGFCGGKYFKADSLGYEGLSEVLASRLALYTNLSKYGIAEYFPCRLKIGNDVFTGCYSNDFVGSEYSDVTFNRLLTRYLNTDLAGVYKYYRDTQDTYGVSFYEFVTEIIFQACGVDIKDWLGLLLRFDWLILNEDRHFGNLMLLRSKTDNVYFPAPLFDCGAGLLSDVHEYVSLEDMGNVLAKPFNTSFEKQVKIAERDIKNTLQFNTDLVKIDISDVKNVYPDKYIRRAGDVLIRQLNKMFPEVKILWQE